MKSIFENELAQEQEIHAQYDAAEAANDEAGMAMDSIEKGNALIDFNDNILDETVPALVETLRACGIEQFTFSSGWSSAVRTAWLFLQNGCTNEGMTLIHTGHYPFRSQEEEMAPAFIFRLT